MEDYTAVEKRLSAKGYNSEWDSALFFQKWTFSVAFPMLELGAKKALQVEDLMDIPDDFSSSKLLALLTANYARVESFWFVPKFMLALIFSTWSKLVACFILNLFESTVRISTPVVMLLLLSALQSPSEWRMAYVWAGIMGLLGISQMFAHHTLYYHSMTMGWNWKRASTAFIYDQLFSLKSTASQTSFASSGMLVNLISNDVQRFEEFSIYCCQSFVSLLDFAAILIILCFFLNVPAAVAGVGVPFLIIPIMTKIASKFAYYRGKTAAATDQRVRYISEIIEGIATVKSYAWEASFYKEILKLRRAEEQCIQYSQVLRAVMLALMVSLHSIISFVTFAVYWGTGGQLTIPKVFATISMLLALRQSVGSWTKGIERGSESIASCRRIEAYLNLVEKENTHSVHCGCERMETLPAREVVVAREVGATSCDIAPADGDTASLKIAPSSYAYRSSEATLKVVLKNVSLSVAAGEVVMVVGPVGSGKSSLLLAALGELEPITDINMQNMPRARTLRTKATLAYCAQKPWIMAATVKANIVLCGKSHTMHGTEDLSSSSSVVDPIKHPQGVDVALYKLAVESCLLPEDLEKWVGYDETEIGERGISVSGGQKARIALARVVYSDADVFLLDDPLSAVDAHVGKALFDRCIEGALQQRQKAVILVTHQLQYLRRATRILVLNKEGEQVFYGSYEELRAQKDLLETLELSCEIEGEGHSGSATPQTMMEHSASPTQATTAEELVGQKVQVERDEVNRDTLKLKLKIKEYDPEYRRKQQTQLQQHTVSVDAAHHATSQSIYKESPEDEQRRKIVSVEDRAVGEISWEVYWNYISAGGFWYGVLVFGYFALAQGELMITDYWLRWWATEAMFDSQRDARYVVIFAALVTFCAGFSFYRAIAWFRFTLAASTELHRKCVYAVIHSPLRFFISNPTGRILNRFAKDQSLSDETLPMTFFDCLQCLMYCLSAVILVCITIPWLILLLPFLLLGFYQVRRYYIMSSREIKRIDAITRSPVYSDFSASLDGLVTLRAYRLKDKANMSFQQLLDINGRAWFSSLMASRWLGFRLDFESAVILTCVSMFAVVLRDQVDTGLLGFTLAYTVALSGVFQWTVRQSAEVETQMTSVERISVYGNLPPEEGYLMEEEREARSGKGVWRSRTRTRSGGSNSGDRGTNACKAASAARSNKDYSGISSGGGFSDAVDGVGEIELAEYANRSNTTAEGGGDLSIRNLTVKYRHDLDPVLTNFTLQIPAGKKVGVCGRTGCGKSTTLLALLRLNIITEGDILLDGVSILTQDLVTSRSHFSIIPQDPHLFSGTLRFNLDPFSVYDDVAIWSALKDAHIAEYVRRDASGLQSAVEEGGKNYSVGQRQLLSLARAILRHSKVVLMDEVTASIDFQTDRLIQETIRTSPTLRSATIITVAHRLRTIADSDQVVVLQAGRVVEQGTPGALLSQEESLFRKLAWESGEFEEIARIANASCE